MPTALPPHARRPLLGAVLAAVCLLGGCRAKREAGADAGRDARARARAVLGDGVSDAVRLRANGAGAGAALVRDSAGAEGARWLVLLDGGRVRGRVHTYLPVEDTAGRFGTVDWDGDGRDEAYAVGSAWAILGVAVEVVVAEPGGVYRYELTDDRGPDDVSIAWSPNLRARPALMGWMAAAAYRVLPEVRAQREARWATSPSVRDWTPLSEEAALEAARQRLGWGVREAIPLSRPYTQAIAVLLAESANGPADHIAVLWGGDGVYDVLWEQESGYGGWIHDHAGRFGVVDAGGDGKPEIFEVNDASGTGGWGVAARLLDAESGEAFEAFAEGSWDDEPGARAPQITWSGNLASRPGARAWLDSAVRVAASADYGGERELPPAEATALAAERAWSAANLDRVAGAVPGPPIRGGVPGAEHASCAVSTDGEDWVARFRGGLWMHDRGRDESRVVYAPPWSARLTSIAVGRRYVWTNLVVADSAGPLALLAYDRRRGALVSVPAPGLALLIPPYVIVRPSDHPMAYACSGVCSAGDALQVRDGTLAIGDVTLTLPPDVRASGELADARVCQVRP